MRRSRGEGMRAARPPPMLVIVIATSIAAPRLTMVRYRIDSDDLIVETGGAWDDFARVNGGLPPVLGRRLWHFVSGAEVRELWAGLLRDVRASGRPLEFGYRCDAPGLARAMRMEVVPSPDGSIAFGSSQVWAVRTPTLSGRWDTGSARAELVVCGWCGRASVGGEWCAAARAIELLDLAGRRPPRLAHGICEACAGALGSPAAA